MNQNDYIKELHTEISKIIDERDALTAKYPVGFGLHKTTLVSAQADKGKWLALNRDKNYFEGVLSYYGYTVGYKNKLEKEVV
tara:strand:- start:351 stop:596 length:246 start_codon:yes stop_codon:yes gene_type:complete